MAATALGLRLKELRRTAGLTQPVLAERAGMSVSGVALIEQGRRKPAWETVVKLAAALGVAAGAFEAAPSTRTKPQGRGRPKKAAPTKGKRKRATR